MESIEELLKSTELISTENQKIRVIWAQSTTYDRMKLIENTLDSIIQSLVEEKKLLYEGISLYRLLLLNISLEEAIHTEMISKLCYIIELLKLNKINNDLLKKQISCFIEKIEDFLMKTLKSQLQIYRKIQKQNKQQDDNDYFELRNSSNSNDDQPILPSNEINKFKYSNQGYSELKTNKDYSYPKSYF